MTTTGILGHILIQYHVLIELVFVRMAHAKQGRAVNRQAQEIRSVTEGPNSERIMIHGESRNMERENRERKRDMG